MSDQPPANEDEMDFTANDYKEALMAVAVQTARRSLQNGTVPEKKRYDMERIVKMIKAEHDPVLLFSAMGLLASAIVDAQSHQFLVGKARIQMKEYRQRNQNSQEPHERFS